MQGRDIPMTDNELLLAISDMLDKKLDARLKPMESRLDRVDEQLAVVGDRLNRVDEQIGTLNTKMTNVQLILENDIRPRLNTIESCYTDTYNRYKDHADKMEAAFVDIDLLKKVVSEHSEKLQKLA